MVIFATFLPPFAVAVVVLDIGDHLAAGISLLVVLRRIKGVELASRWEEDVSRGDFLADSECDHIAARWTQVAEWQLLVVSC